MTGLPPDSDVVIVGAGPAGLSAAAALAGLGHKVLVLDREATPGGVPRHCTHSPYGLREFARPMTGPRYAKALTHKAKSAGAQIATGITVTRLLPGPALEITGPHGPATLHPRAVLLATGARESTRSERLIGGTKPQGVLSTGALQLLLGAGARPFHRPVILGTELVAFSALLSCRLAGIRPVAMVEPGPRTAARWPTGLFPRLQGIPVHYGTGIRAIHGHTRVTGVLLDNDLLIPCDGLLVTGRFKPDAPLLAGSPIAIDPATGGPEIDQYGRCTAPGYFAAGNLLRAVETAGWCWAEGRAIAGAIHAHLSGTLPEGAGTRIAATGTISAVIPQRVSPGPRLGLPALQLQVSQPGHGHLSLQASGHILAGRRLHARPHRRLLLPLPPPGKPATVGLTPDTDP